MNMLSPILINLERVLVGLLAVVALLLAVVSFRGLVPVTDPLTPVGFVDKLSLLFGLHEKSHVVVINVHQWTTDVHVFAFQKRLKDGAFHLTSEKRIPVSVSLLDTKGIETNCQKVLTKARSGLPFTASVPRTPLLLGLPSVLSHLEQNKRQELVTSLHTCLDQSNFDYSREGGLGVIGSSLQTTMQWFALALLNGRLPFLKPSDTPVIAETSADYLLVTMAVSDVSRLGNSSVIQSKQRIEVFGEVWDLVTVKLPDLGVLKARQMVLTNRKPDSEVAASPCVNPVVDRVWDYEGKSYHVKGLQKSVEEVRERNGPFAGKKVSRPVANYQACHSNVLGHLNSSLGNRFDAVIKELKRRKVYIRGKLFIKCAERGLTDPFKGGNVKLKTFMDSLKHACKVPNTDQPYACVDMMVVGVVLDKVLGLHQGSTLLTPHTVNGMTGDWPVTAALQAYQMGV